MEQSSNKSRAFMSKLDDQQLRQILLAEVESDDTDVDLIRNITAVLESRDHAGTEIDAQKAYQSFVEEHSEELPLYDELLKNSDSTRKRKSVRVSRITRVGIVAAIILSVILVTTGIASAVGIDVWGTLTKWTTKTFGLTIGKQDRSDDYFLPSDAYQDLRQIMTRFGGTDNVVPHYLPEGYELCELSDEATYAGTVVTAMYMKGSEEIIVHYTIGTINASSLYPKDLGDPITYEYSGILHYLFENENEWVAIWQRDNIACQVSGVSSEEELLAIINSIYEGK